MSKILAVVVLAGCATGPRVVEVTGTKHLETVGAADKKLFLTDRASRITFESGLLPAAERGEEFYVRWTGTNVDLVKFEYRQVNVANTVKEQTFIPGQERGGGQAGSLSHDSGSPPKERRGGGQAGSLSHAGSPPRDRHWHLFAVRGDDYINGGLVSAWRVSLWSGGTNGTFLTERTSAVW